MQLFNTCPVVFKRPAGQWRGPDWSYFPSGQSTNLPAEVLLKIFHVYVGLGQDRGCRGVIDNLNKGLSRPPMVLTYVCSAWRTYGIGDPSLWTTIRIDGDAVNKTVSLFLERSSPLLFDLIIHNESNMGWETTVGKILKQEELEYPV